MNAWEQEYLANIQPQQLVRKTSPASEPIIASPFGEDPDSAWYESWFDYAEDEESVKGFIT